MRPLAFDKGAATILARLNPPQADEHVEPTLPEEIPKARAGSVERCSFDDADSA